MDEITELFRQIKKEHYLSVRSMAKEIGISSTALQKLLKGENRPSLETLIKLQGRFPDAFPPVAAETSRRLQDGDMEAQAHFARHRNELVAAAERKQNLQSIFLATNQEQASTPNSPGFEKPSTPIAPKPPDFPRLSATLVKNIDNVNEIYNRHLYIPEAAHGGYAVGFADEGYHDSGVLVLDLPFLPKPGRTFEVSGDSMEPIFSDGDYIVCGQVDDAQAIKEGMAYVLVSATAGVSVKFIHLTSDYLLAIPANQRDYAPVRYLLEEVRELWQVEWHVTRHFLHPVVPINSPALADRVEQIREWLLHKFPDFPGHV